MRARKHLTGLEAVFGAAVRTHGEALGAHVQVDLGMRIPQDHFGLGAGTKNAALVIQVCGEEFNGLLGAHGGISSLRRSQA